MYAIIDIDGKQHKVREGEEIDVDLFESASKQVKFDRVLFLGGNEPKVGAPLVPGCVVHGELVDGIVKGPKVIAFKYKKCKNYRRTVGHRQKYTRVKITKIEA